MKSIERRESAPTLLSEASEADIPELIDIERSVGSTNTYSAMLSEADWREELGTCTVKLIKRDGKTVGSIAYQEKTPDHVYISGIIVRPESQGQGIAKDALRQVLDTYSNAARIDLVTHPDNPALHLYESLGFKVEDRKENYWGEGHPRLILALTR